jgi:hypothetical protein
LNLSGALGKTPVGLFLAELAELAELAGLVEAGFEAGPFGPEAALAEGLVGFVVLPLPGIF